VNFTKVDTMNSVKSGNHKIEERNLTIVTAPSQGAVQVVRESTLNPSSPVMPGLQHETKDVLKQFKSNLVQLEALTSQMGHLLSDVRSVIRR
jgi:hypothetical protein